MLKVECEKCKAPYQVDERRVPPTGQKMRCPKCGHTFLVVAPGSPGSEAPHKATVLGFAISPSAVPPPGPAPAAEAAAGAPVNPRARTRQVASGEYKDLVKKATTSARPPYIGPLPDAPGLGDIDELNDLPAVSPAGLPTAVKPLPAVNPTLMSRQDVPMAKPQAAAPSPDEIDLPSPTADLPAPAVGLAAAKPGRPSGGTGADLPAVKPVAKPPAAGGGLSFDIDLPAAAVARPGDLPARKAPPPVPKRPPPPKPQSADLPARRDEAGLPARPDDAGLPAVFGDAGLPAVFGGVGLPAPAGGGGFGSVDLPAVGGGVGLPAPAGGRAAISRRGSGAASVRGPGSLPAACGRAGRPAAHGGEGRRAPADRCQRAARGVRRRRPRGGSGGHRGRLRRSPVWRRRGHSAPAAAHGGGLVASGAPSHAVASSSASSPSAAGAARRRRDRRRGLRRARFRRRSRGDEFAVDGHSGEPSIPAPEPGAEVAVPTTDMPPPPKPREQVVIQKGQSRTPKLILAGLVAAVVAGALLQLTDYGLFGFKFINDQVHKTEWAAAATSAMGAARKAIGADLYDQCRAAADTIANQSAALPRARAMTAAAALTEYEFQVRFGRDASRATRADAWLKSIADVTGNPASVQYYSAATGGRAAAAGDIAGARALLEAASHKDAGDPVQQDIALLRGDPAFLGTGETATPKQYQKSKCARGRGPTHHLYS